MNFFEKIEEPLMVFGDKINNIKFFAILRDAFMLAFPLTIFGSITLIIANFPFLSTDIQAILGEYLGPASTATMNIMSVFVSIGIGYYYARSEDVDPIFGAVVSLVAFLILTPWLSGNLVEVNDAGVTTNTLLEGVTVITTERLGAKSMFLAMIAGFSSSWLYCWVTHKNWTIKMPEQVPPAVAKSFAALIPACLTLSVFLIVHILFTFTPWGNINDFIYELVQAPLTGLGGSLAATIVAIFFVQLFFGLHGQIIVNSMMDPIWNSLMYENLDKYTAGQAVENIVTKPFMETFTVGLGGSGATLIVVIMLAFLIKNKQLNDIGRLALAPGIFNVNEPLIFGLPIILNPIVAIPWILAPVISVTVAYLAMASGLVPLTTGVSVPWTVPVIISGFLATNSWQGSVLQIVQMALVGVIWYPFLRTLAKQSEAIV